MPLEIRDEWLVALGKAASFLRHQATNEPNVKAIVADEYRSVAATLTDLENNLLGDRGRQVGPGGVPNEDAAQQFRKVQSVRNTEGTRESVERCVQMLNTYATDLFPANDKGQVPFARAMMESVADEVAKFLGTLPPAPAVAPGASGGTAGENAKGGQ